MTKLIPFLDAITPFVQAFDVVLVLIAGVYCFWSVARRRSTGLLILGVSCFLSAVILLGFFVYGVAHGRGLVPQAGYVLARVLAPFELLLFAIGIVAVARGNLRKAEPRA